MWIHNYERHSFHEMPYECQCFEITVGNEEWECKSKFTIESINNALQGITLSFEVIHSFFFL